MHQPSRAYLLETYGDRKGSATRPAIDPLIIRRPRELISDGSIFYVIEIRQKKMISKMFLNISRGIFSEGSSMATPALLMKHTSMYPWSQYRLMVSENCMICCSSRRSRCMAITEGSFLKGLCSRYEMITVWPCLVKNSAERFAYATVASGDCYQSHGGSSCITCILWYYKCKNLPITIKKICFSRFQFVV